MMNHFLYAINLLTILPAPSKNTPSPGDSGRSAGWFSTVGLVIGLATAVVWWGLKRIFPALPAAGLTLAVWVWLSGGLHLDGLADCCDGLFHPSSPERRLEIMRDPRLGSFGGVGLVLLLALKIAAISTLPTGRTGFLAILLAAALARWLVLPAGYQPLARPGGMGADFAQGLRPSSLVWGSLIPLGLVALTFPRGAAALLAALAACAGVIFLARRRIGGVTGDVFGAVIELTELAVLLAFCAGG